MRARAEIHAAVWMFTLSVLAPVSANQSGPEQDLPQTCDAAIELIVSNLDESSKQALRETPRNELVKFDRTWGRGIRASFNLADGNFVLLDSCIGDREMSYHPLSASMIIMEGVWDAVVATDYPAEETPDT